VHLPDISDKLTSMWTWLDDCWGLPEKCTTSYFLSVITQD